MKIFLSHITEEKELAFVLKDWIESTFAGSIDVFVSSDIENIPGGKNWLNIIDQALKDSSLYIVLCSERSISRPWINFETGCGWIKKVPILPICHTGMTKSNLPKPLSLFQAIDLNDEKFVEKLISSIAKNLSFNKIPRIDTKKFHNELLESIERIEYRDDEKNNTSSNGKPTSKLSEELEEVLKLFANTGPDDKIKISQVSSRMRVSPQKAEYFLDELTERDLINFVIIMGEPDTPYYLTSDGRKYLFEHGYLD